MTCGEMWQFSVLLRLSYCFKNVFEHNPKKKEAGEQLLDVNKGSDMPLNLILSSVLAAGRVNAGVLIELACHGIAY